LISELTENLYFTVSAYLLLLSDNIIGRFKKYLFLHNSMKTEKSFQEKIHDRLLAVRRGTVGKNGLLGRFESQLANDVVFNLALAAQDGKLTADQYQHFAASTRADLVSELLFEARELLNQNRTKYEVSTKPYGMTDAEMNLEKNVYRLTRAQLSEKHSVNDWHSSYRVNGEVYVDDVLYGRFLREHGLTDQRGAQITEADLPQLDGGNSVMSRYKTLQRGRL
jgi:hypothetical protein